MASPRFLSEIPSTRDFTAMPAPQQERCILQLLDRFLGVLEAECRPATAWESSCFMEAVGWGRLRAYPIALNELALLAHDPAKKKLAELDGVEPKSREELALAVTGLTQIRRFT